MTKAEIKLPPGCLLRKANSSNMVEFKQLQRQNIIDGFPQLLVFLIWLSLGVIFLLLLLLWILGLFFPLAITYHPFLLALGLIWFCSISGFVLGLFAHNNSVFDLSNTWCIKCQGRLVGWGTLSRNTKGSVILCLFVVKTWRRRGLGSALVKRIIQEAPPPLSLVCITKLVSFYNRLGFVRSGSNIFGGKYMVYKGLENRYSDTLTNRRF